jgi:hypothetical protein
MGQLRYGLNRRYQIELHRFVIAAGEGSPFHHVNHIFAHSIGLPIFELLFLL